MPSPAPNAGSRSRTQRGDRIYAIGDIHGRYDLLRLLLDRVAAHNSALPPAKSLYIIFLGDLIDRGADSRKVLDFLMEQQRGAPGIIVLQGNHEEVLLQVLDGDARALRSWLTFGGAETLASFGVVAPEEGILGPTIDALRAAIPRQQEQWLRKLPLTATSGDYFFCHAGVRPGVALRRQSRADLLWIRDEFLDDTSDYGAVVVHGHSIEPEVKVRFNRIGIDTGAYATGVLTALYLEDEQRAVIQTE